MTNLFRIYKCRKKLDDKLVEEFTENIDEGKLVKITLAEYENEYENICKCLLHFALHYYQCF